MTDKIKIAIVAANDLASLASETIKDIIDPSVDISIIRTSLDNFYKTLNASNLSDIDIFISGGMYAQLLLSGFSKPVVIIRKNSIDYLLAILEAKKTGKKMALTLYKDEPIIDFNEIRKLSNADITPLFFSNIENLKVTLRNSDYDTVIGAALSTEAATECGIKSYLVYNGKSSIIDAINSAKELYASIEDRKKKTTFFESILNFNPNAMLITDESGIITDVNPSAEIILHVKPEKVVRKSIKTIFSNADFSPVLSFKKSQMELVSDFNGHSYSISVVLVEQNLKAVGFMLTLHEVTAVENETRNQKKEQITFAAKSSFSDIVGKSYILREQIDRAKKYSRTDANILITGETGVGKEIFAQSIHNYSYRYKYPFVAVNCAAIPPSILESELFGYDEGAFTGSRKGGKKGLFELADNGTIFLDEIGELPFNLQSRLLRVLQEKEILRLGGTSSTHVNTRVICATNKDLDSMIPDKFREDLFYRISVLHIELPPLRDRGDDVLELFSTLLSRYHNINDTNLTPDNLEILKHYSWPGNIREMQNVIARFSVELNSLVDVNKKSLRALLIYCIGEKRLINDIFKRYGVSNAEGIKNKSVMTDLIDEFSKVFPKQNEKIAEIMGISRTTLWRLHKESS